MGSGIIARVLIVAGVCGAAYLGFVVASPADGSVGNSQSTYGFSAVAEPEDATAEALARRARAERRVEGEERRRRFAELAGAARAVEPAAASPAAVP